MWIKCSDRTPPSWTTVLCYTNDIVFGQLEDREWFEIPFGWEIQPSHWMPLPEVPNVD